jgi:aspartyl/asparaginyl beta-hydroxylase (cupin superfamily)
VQGIARRSIFGDGTDRTDFLARAAITAEAQGKRLNQWVAEVLARAG